MYYVYILATQYNGTFYVGMTSDLPRRIWEHREGVVAGFTKKYGVYRLVYYEAHADVHEAIRREKSIKRWGRAMKISVIERENPHWEDLYHYLNA
jgi:putative endonuclease